jgi:hypothetical protein
MKARPRCGRYNPPNELVTGTAQIRLRPLGYGGQDFIVGLERHSISQGGLAMKIVAMDLAKFKTVVSQS